MEAWKIELYYGSNELYHYGTKGQKWGVRRWQNEDGTFNEAGKKRYFDKGTGDNYQALGRSIKGDFHRLAAANHLLSEKAWARSNKTVSSMNRSAKNYQLKKAEEADRARAERIASKMTAKSITKDLNKTDKKLASLKSKEAVAKFKRDRALNRGNIKKADKYQAKLDTQRNKIDRNKARTNALINVANKKGYTVNSRETTRYADLGKKIAKSYLSPIAGQAILIRDVSRRIRMGKEASGVVKGTKYSVVNDTYNKEKYN